MIEHIIFAKDREELVAATKALDRVLLWNFYVVPQFTYEFQRYARWDRFSHARAAAEIRRFRVCRRCGGVTPRRRRKIGQAHLEANDITHGAPQSPARAGARPRRARRARRFRPAAAAEAGVEATACRRSAT